MKMKPDQDRSHFFKLAIIWLAIFLVGSFWLSVRSVTDPIILTVMPEVPREGEPVMATFKLNNPTEEPIVASYQFYADGVLLREGQASLAPHSSKTYQYAYENPLLMGEQLNFMLRSQSSQGSFEKALATPPYPPQIWSSFVSFASFSTSVMSSMSTMAYYQGSFSDVGLNIGLVTSVVLIVLLIFLELPITHLQGRTVAIVGSLRIRLSTLAWILLIIFLGMVYTKVAMIIAGSI